MCKTNMKRKSTVFSRYMLFLFVSFFSPNKEKKPHFTMEHFFHENKN